MEQKTKNTEKGTNINAFIPFYFSDFVKGTRKYWWLVVVLTVLFGGVRFYYGYKQSPPV